MRTAARQSSSGGRLAHFGRTIAAAMVVAVAVSLAWGVFASFLSIGQGRGWASGGGGGSPDVVPLPEQEDEPAPLIVRYDSVRYGYADSVPIEKAVAREFADRSVRWQRALAAALKQDAGVHRVRDLRRPATMAQWRTLIHSLHPLPSVAVQSGLVFIRTRREVSAGEVDENAKCVAVADGGDASEPQPNKDGKAGAAPVSQSMDWRVWINRLEDRLSHQNDELKRLRAENEGLLEASEKNHNDFLTLDAKTASCRSGGCFIKSTVKGWRGGQFSWRDAREKCQDMALDLCFRNTMCVRQKPVKGVMDGDVWTPALDFPNTWVSVGELQKETRLCKMHRELWRVPPPWGLQRMGGTSAKHVIYCCGRDEDEEEEEEEESERSGSSSSEDAASSASSGGSAPAAPSGQKKKKKKKKKKREKKKKKVQKWRSKSKNSHRGKQPAGVPAVLDGNMLACLAVTERRQLPHLLRALQEYNVLCELGLNITVIVDFDDDAVKRLLQRRHLVSDHLPYCHARKAVLDIRLHGVPAVTTRRTSPKKNTDAAENKKHLELIMKLPVVGRHRLHFKRLKEQYKFFLYHQDLHSLVTHKHIMSIMSAYTQMGDDTTLVPSLVRYRLVSVADDGKEKDNVAKALAPFVDDWAYPPPCTPAQLAKHRVKKVKEADDSTDVQQEPPLFRRRKEGGVWILLATGHHSGLFVLSKFAVELAVRQDSWILSTPPKREADKIAFASPTLQVPSLTPMIPIVNISHFLVDSSARDSAVANPRADDASACVPTVQELLHAFHFEFSPQEQRVVWAEA